jgi:hypothetical protein
MAAGDHQGRDAVASELPCRISGLSSGLEATGDGRRDAGLQSPACSPCPDFLALPSNDQTGCQYRKGRKKDPMTINRPDGWSALMNAVAGQA